MAMTIGSVEIADDLSWSGSGMAAAIFQERASVALAAFEEELPEDLSDEGLAALTQGRREQLMLIANEAMSLARAIVPYIQDNADVTVTITTSDSGLQRMPASTTEDTPTKAPGTNKTLTGSVA